MGKYQSKSSLKVSLKYRLTGLLMIVISAQFIFCKCQQKQVETKPVGESVVEESMVEESVVEESKPEGVKSEAATTTGDKSSPDDYEGLTNYDMTPSEEAQYVKEINASRAGKDKFLRSDETPLAPEIVGLFTKLSYFAPNKNFIVNAVFKKFKNQDTVELLTSKGTIRKMIRAGEFLFKINGSRQKLTAYLSIGGEQTTFFVPFLDKTNRTSTYKGGRYLDIDRKDVDFYVIDFNQSYNPYCAYNIKYSCPIVPPENTITKEIRAGEKDFVITIKM